MVALAVNDIGIRCIVVVCAWRGIGQTGLEADVNASLTQVNKTVILTHIGLRYRSIHRRNTDGLRNGSYPSITGRLLFWAHNQRSQATHAALKPCQTELIRVGPASLHAKTSHVGGEGCARPNPDLSLIHI